MKHTLRLLIALAVLGAGSAHAQIDLNTLSAMHTRSIGPTGMSGRVGAADAVDANPNIIYVGAATGGVWKSVDGGYTWAALTDSLPMASVGAITIYQSNPDVVWVGTGERNRRNSAGVGTGVYRSLDGGKTWDRAGLENTGAIDAILIDPRDANVVYVGALGNTWADTPDRGVYKTIDGGKTWSKILYVNERTGAGDMVMDPSNPNHLLVGMWEHRRWPWYFKSGGPGSGLYASYDGGVTWKKQGPEDGLPAGDLGRVGMDYARGNPDVVYALTEANQSVLLRSEDGGDSWTTVNRTRGIDGRPFYYGQVRVDPTNRNRVWIVESPLRISEDGGKTFRNLFSSYQDVHVDNHALWVGPDGKHIVDGNDGGVYISLDGGHAFRHVRNLPLSQFYHIAVDTTTPYHVYGGLQDNGSFIGPGVTWHNGGIRFYDWEEVDFGDGMTTFPDPDNPRYGYTSTQNGDIVRFDRLTGERHYIKPAPPADSVSLRFNWNPGMASDPFDHATYLGSQYLHRSADHGATWTTISPDLTTNDPAHQMADTSGGLTYDATGAEAFESIIAIAPSPVQRGVIWVGTDDGNVQVTRDGGKTWTNVAGNIKGVPAGTWVPEIHASRFDAATAFVVFDNHRRGDNRPYLLKTTNYGRSWTSLVTSNLDYFLHAIEQDPVNANLLYLGSEFGLFLSLDGGKSWARWSGIPRVPVRGLVVHPTQQDLVIGTHGRGAYVLDDVRPLRALAQDPSVANENLHLFTIPPTILYNESQVNSPRFTGFTLFQGENRPYGALVSYWVKAGGDSARATIQVLDAEGTVVRTFNGPAKSGLNRTAWNLRLDGPRRPSGPPGGGGGGGFFGGFGGPEVLPGTYTVRVIVKGDTTNGSVDVAPDPRFSYSMDARRQKLEVLQRVMRRQEVSFEALDRLRRAQQAVDAVIERTKGDTSYRSLRQAGDSLKRQITTVIEDQFTGRQDAQGILRDPNTVNARLGDAYGQLGSSWAAPTPTEMTLVTQAASRLERALGPINDVLGRVEQYRQRVDSAGVEIFKPIGTISMDWRPEG